MLYSLSISDPEEMCKQFKANKAVPKRIFEGTYKVAKNVVTIEVQLHYCLMYFRLLILDADLYSGRNRGKHNRLQLLEHASIPLLHQTTLVPVHKVSFTLPSYTDFSFHRYY